MRLKCLVDVVNRDAINIGIRGGRKGAQALLFLTRKEENVFLICCTSKVKEGVKYKVSGNIRQVFIKYVAEGKGTVSLNNPPVDLYINKAEPTDLKRILFALKMAQAGKSLSNLGIFSSMAPVKSKEVEKPRTKLMITRKQDYPVTKSFASSLEHLRIVDCGLAKFDTRWYALKHLTVLDLSSNKIKYIPAELVNMSSLSQLLLTHNQLSEFPSALCDIKSNFCKNLRSLDLSHNLLQFLPSEFSQLTELWELRINHNFIEILPKAFGRLKKLRKLSVTHNSLKVLPSSFCELSNLEVCDMYMNPFMDITQITEFNNSNIYLPFDQVKTLKETAARIIKKDNIFYSNPDYVPHVLIEYLNYGSRCICGKHCFEVSQRHLSLLDTRLLCHTITGLTSSGNVYAPIVSYSCSYKCFLICKKRSEGLRNANFSIH